ncbi:MAG: hypothetical protein IT550_03625 [Novosphingobium sp.]|nr:hypothetical protein [Novosphingobium sp.]
MPKIRSPIARITVTPTEKKGLLTIQPEGRLTQIIALATGKPAPKTECAISMERVAGIEPA